MLAIMEKRPSLIIIVIITIPMLLCSENVHSASLQSLQESVTQGQAGENSYLLSEGFRSIKWGTRLVDAKKTYPDLLFVEQIPKTDPKYLYYRRKNENKKFSGLEWDKIQYVFTEEKVFVAADVVMRLELEDKDKAISQYDDFYQNIAAKYGKPFHSEKTNKEGYPFVYYSIWHVGSESVSLELKSLRDHWIYKNSGVENRISMLEFKLNFYSKKAEGKAIDF
jgi:hypothetical protein